MVKSLLVLVFLGACWLQDPDGDPSPEGVTAAAQQYKSAQAVWDHLERKGAEPESRYRWSCRLAEAAVAAGEVSAVDAYRAHLKRMLRMEELVENLRRLGRAGSVDLAIHGYYVAEARVWSQQAERGER